MKLNFRVFEMGKSIKVMKRQLRALDEEKKLFNVFDEAKNDYAYKRHKREVTTAEWIADEIFSWLESL